MESIIITGAYGGMGRATVKNLLKKGYRIFALDVKIEESKDENLIPISVDITSEESLLKAKKTILSYTDKIHAIIHYAGLYMLDSLIEIESSAFKKIVSVNFIGPYLVNKVFYSLLKTNSRIIIVTSELATIKPLPFTGLYAVTKTALDRYAYSLLMETQLNNIYVSVIRSGAVKTNMIKKSTTELSSFVNKTELYRCNAKRFKKIVDTVEAKSITAKELSQKTISILEKKKPHFSYSINRNIFLNLTHLCPSFIELKIIKKILS